MIETAGTQDGSEVKAKADKSVQVCLVHDRPYLHRRICYRKWQKIHWKFKNQWIALSVSDTDFYCDIELKRE